MELVAGVLVAVAGWLVNEYFTRRSVRRNLRIEYLLSAYRRLEQASNRTMSGDHETALEEAISDIQLLGSPAQVEMATQFARQFAANQRADTEPILEDLRASLRKELQLEPVPPQRMWLRIARDSEREIGPTIGDRSWAVWEQRTVAVAASVRAAVAELEKPNGGPPHSLPGASPFVVEMLALARSSPVGAVSASLDRLGHELATRLQTDGAGGVTGLNVNELAALALERKLINSPTRDGIEGLAVMHTMAMLDDGGRRLLPEHALDYVGLTEGLLLALRLPPQATTRS